MQDDDLLNRRKEKRKAYNQDLDLENLDPADISYKREPPHSNEKSQAVETVDFDWDKFKMEGNNFLSPENQRQQQKEYAQQKYFPGSVISEKTEEQWTCSSRKRDFFKSPMSLNSVAKFEN